MSLSDSINAFFRNFQRALNNINASSEVRQFVIDEINVSRKKFLDVFEKDWSQCSTTDRDEAIENVKKQVIDKMIPAAGVLSLAGAPGILVYTPCQIMGGFAVAYIRAPDFKWKSNKNVLTIVSLLFWGKAGQVTFQTLLSLLGDLVPMPVISMAVIPFVQQWTRLALDRVDEFYGDVIDLPKPLPELQPEEALLFEVTAQAQRLSGTLARGGKIMYEAQQKVVEELCSKSGSTSVMQFGQTHIFQGVAGSGKTVVMAQMVPHLVEAFQDAYGREPRILVYHFNNYIRRLLKEEIHNALKAARPSALNPEKLCDRIAHIHTLATLTEVLSGESVGLLKGKPEFVSSEEVVPNAEKANALQQLLKHKQGIYDIILIDEGQDVSEDEYRLVFDLCRQDEHNGGRSAYIFYDDLQTIFGGNKKVKDRLSSSQVVEHFLPQCIRTSKRIMDFTMNTCLSPALDADSRSHINRMMNMDRLQDKGLVSATGTGQHQWIDCKFCVFSGEVTPDIRSLDNNKACIDTLCEEIANIRSGTDGHTFDGSILVLCISNAMVKSAASALTNKFGAQSVRKRSGDEITSIRKRDELVVEGKKINIATIGDAKGYDADVVFIINPDGTQEMSEIDKRLKFYVAATRAKQFLGVYSSIPQARATLIRDATRALQMMQAGEL